ELDFAAFHAAYEALVEKARTNRLMPDDFAGGTIQLTNPGTLGTVASVPRLMKGQGSIIATGTIRDIAPPGAKIITITSTYDHRIIQGAESGMFLRTLDSPLQGEERFYDDVTESPAGARSALRATYCGTIAYEVEHIGSHEERLWLRQVIESGQHRRPLSADGKKQLLARLTAVDTLERFLHKAYLGQKRFSIEGLDMTVPMLDFTLELAAAHGTRQATIGMAHRGRLNVLAHVVNVPYETILAEFEGGRREET